MRVRNFIRKVILLSLVLTGSVSLAAHRPNVIFLNIDNHSKWSLSFYGNRFVQTPNIDRLLAEGIRFENFHTAGRCTSSRSALLTGRYHARNGAMGTGSAWGQTVEGVTTMGHVFSDNGYRTAMFGKWHMGDTYPLRPEDRGFQEVVTIHNGSTLGKVITRPGYNNSSRTGAGYRFRHNGVWKEFKGWRIDTWFAELNRYLEDSRGTTKPFFVYLATVTAHGPHFGPRDLRAAYKSKYEQDEWKALRDRFDAASAKKRKKPSGSQPVSYPYDHAADIAGLDRNVGRLLDTLDELDLSENTIVLYTSDGAGGGPATLPHEQRSRAFGPSSLPFTLRWPSGQTDSMKPSIIRIANLDLLPTLAGLCGITLSEDYLEQIDGRDFGRLLGREAAPPWGSRAYVADHQSSAGKEDINDQMVLRPFANTTIHLPDGYSVSWKNSNPDKRAAPERIKEAETVYREWLKRVTADFPLGSFAMVGDDKNLPVYLEGYPILDGPAGAGIRNYFLLDVGSSGTYALSGNTQDRYGGELATESPTPVSVWLSRKDKSGRLPVDIDPAVRGYRVTAETLKAFFKTTEMKCELPASIPLERGRYLIFVEGKTGQPLRALRVEKRKD